jgi:malate dehydrogenase (oxaloacetate-decarboxylating)(NADP+)
VQSSGTFIDGAIGYADQPYHLRKPINVDSRRVDLIHDSLYNKGAAFSLGERDRLGLRGLLPSRKITMENQVERVKIQLDKEDSMIRKNVFLRDLQDYNETLFHRVLLDNIVELAPVIYTPTVGQACIEFGEQFRRPRGMYFNHHDHGDMAAMMNNWCNTDVKVAVITDGSRILGLGDLGANGMGIPIGKLALYCAAGGIAPHRVLPVMFDAGTDNTSLQESDLYLGLQHPRLQGEPYMDMMDEFVAAFFNRYPDGFLQFEDFSSDKAMDILNRYRHKRLCFNDDIQGTGAVAVAGLMSALRLQGNPVSALKDQKFLIAGAGSAGIGVATALAETMVTQGLSPQEAYSQFWVCDVNGVLRADGELSEQQMRFGRSDDTAGLSLLEAAKKVKPNVLIGVTACGGLFQEELIRLMADVNDQPIIFPLSNPTSSAECTNQQALQWTNGRAIFASGSPFDPVEVNGTTFVPSQCNNMYIFPGIGLGCTVAKAKVCSDSMIYAASVAVAESLTEQEMRNGQVFPTLDRIREVAQAVAAGVAQAAVDEGLAREKRAIIASEEGLMKQYVQSKMYDPVYVPLAPRPGST